MFTTLKHLFACRLLTNTTRKNRKPNARFRPTLEYLEDRTAPATLTWNGPVNGLWSNAGNWLDEQGLPGVPGAFDSVQFNNTSVNASKIDANFAGNVGRLDILAGYSGTISLDRTLTVAFLTQSNGAFAGPSSLTVTANGNLSGGILGGTGNPVTSNLIIPQNASLNVSNNVSLAGRIIQNSGTINWDVNNADSVISTSDGGYINNLAPGRILLQGQVGGVATLSGQGSFFNSGFVQAAADTTLNLSVPATSYQGTFNAEGMISFNASATFLGGTPSAQQAATFTGNGGIFGFTGASFAVSGSLTSTVKLLQFNGGASISDTLTILDGEAVFAGNTSISGLLLIQGNGFAGPNGSAVFDAPVTVSGITSQITIKNGALLKIHGNLTIDGGRLLNESIAAPIEWTGGNITTQAGGRIDNSGEIQINGNAGNITGNGTLTNSRELVFGKSCTIGPTLNNNGDISVSSGTLTIDHDWTQDAGGQIYFLGGHLQVNGDFINNGSLTVSDNVQLAVNTLTNNNEMYFSPRVVLAGLPVTPYSLTVNPRPNVMGGGNFTQGANGTLSLTITANDANDRVVVNGTATLGGNLTVQLTNGVGIPTNWSWAVITGQRQQRFATFNQPFGFSAPSYTQAAVRVQNPDIIRPGPQIVNEDTTLAFSAANGNSINFPDPDAGAATLQMSLWVANGTLTLSGTSGLTFSSGDGSADMSMTFVGDIDAINAALEGLVFAPTPNFHGQDTLNITVSDVPQSGGFYYDTDSVSITVNSVNDAPSGFDANIFMSQNTTFTFNQYSFGFSDSSDMPFNNLLGVYIDSLPTVGVLLLNGNAVVAGQFISLADLSTLTYTPPANQSGNGLASFTFRVKDDGGTANGGTDTDLTANTIAFDVMGMP
ncbi:MAG: hypothetical protein HYX68_29435 [Planctomycetes bacterium]|nr:hypothetical protein [Planctomycetota bacterium]